MSNNQYGDNRRKWHPNFIIYMEMIVNHPNYNGMPWAIDDKGVILWNAPSNRPPGGKWSNLHDERLEWWKLNAKSVNIATEGKWISKTAKKIHPTGNKPCQTCGRLFEIPYVYPTRNTINKINEFLEIDSQLDYLDFLSIKDVINHLFQEIGENTRSVLHSIFPSIPEDCVKENDLIRFFIEYIIPSEPRGKLSPGAMSNAPDRLDGFHTYNLCCRTTQDTGRTSSNLKTYGSDRRAFEFWCEGNWAAANFIMNQTIKGTCSDCGKEKSMTADHIGPISLGFAHTPFFVPLCKSCNSSKGNRMSFEDIKKLIDLENQGMKIISWQTEFLWNNCKKNVDGNEKALLLSKLLRINQHHYLCCLFMILNSGSVDALLQFLSPEYAKKKYQVIDLHQDYSYGKLIETTRNKTYAESKAARMVRIAFDSLLEYSNKSKRNIQHVEDVFLENELIDFENAIQIAVDNPSRWRYQLINTLKIEDAEIKTAYLDNIFDGQYKPDLDYDYIKSSLDKYMNKVGLILTRRFNENRAIRRGD